MASTMERPTALSFSSKRRRRRNGGASWIDRLRALAGLTTKPGKNIDYDNVQPFALKSDRFGLSL